MVGNLIGKIELGYLRAIPLAKFFVLSQFQWIKKIFPIILKNLVLLIRQS